MAYGPELAERIDLLSMNWPGFTCKKMFGGLGYLLQGNMAFGIWTNQLVVRCGLDRYDEFLARKHVHEFDVTGRPMQGWLLIAPEAIADRNGLLYWLEIGRDFAATLPSKDPSENKPTSPRGKTRRSAEKNAV